MDYKIKLAENQTFETDRLLLRKIELSDAEDIYEYASDEKIAIALGSLPFTSIDKVKSLISSYYMDNRLTNWGIVDKTTNKFIGVINLKIDKNQGEFGWVINKKFWGRGLVTEAALSIRNFSFNTLKMEVLFGMHEVENYASGKVMKKIGMKNRGQVWHSYSETGKPHLMDYWAITISEYNDIKEAKSE